MTTSYELFLHWKQGDDFAACLEATKGDVPEALRRWASQFTTLAEVCETLAERLTGLQLDVNADTHHISFDSSDPAVLAVLATLAQEDLLSAHTWEDEEDDRLSIVDEATYRFWDGREKLDAEHINVIIAENDEHAEVVFKQLLPILDEDAAAILFLIRTEAADIHYVDEGSDSADSDSDPDDEDDASDDEDEDVEDDFRGSLVRFVHVPMTLSKEELIPSFIAFIKARTCGSCGGEKSS